MGEVYLGFSGLFYLGFRWVEFGKRKRKKERKKERNDKRNGRKEIKDQITWDKIK